MNTGGRLIAALSALDARRYLPRTRLGVRARARRSLLAPEVSVEGWA
jgi:hypothetical protein